MEAEPMEAEGPEPMEAEGPEPMEVEPEVEPMEAEPMEVEAEAEAEGPEPMEPKEASPFVAAAAESVKLRRRVGKSAV